jgi:hypothetical protein
MTRSCFFCSTIGFVLSRSCAWRMIMFHDPFCSFHHPRRVSPHICLITAVRTSRTRRSQQQFPRRDVAVALLAASQGAKRSVWQEAGTRKRVVQRMQRASGIPCMHLLFFSNTHLSLLSPLVRRFSTRPARLTFIFTAGSPVILYFTRALPLSCIALQIDSTATPSIQFVFDSIQHSITFASSSP